MSCQLPTDNPRDHLFALLRLDSDSSSDTLTVSERSINLESVTVPHTERVTRGISGEIDLLDLHYDERTNREKMVIRREFPVEA